MRIAVFSDIHGNNYALEAILKDIRTQNIDETFCLGDCIAIGPNPKATLTLIKDHKVNLVLGNHERYFVEGLENFDLTDRELAHQRWNQAQLDQDDYICLSHQPLQIERKLLGHHFMFQHFPYDEENFDFYPAQKLSGNCVDKIFKSGATYNFIGHHHCIQHLNRHQKHYINIESSGCVSSNQTYYHIINIFSDHVSVLYQPVTFDFNKLEMDMRHCRNPEMQFLAKAFFNIDI